VIEGGIDKETRDVVIETKENNIRRKSNSMIECIKAT
jgi:hypothetical protein